LAAVIAASSAVAQDQFPDLTGTWKANIDKCVFLGNAPDEMIVKIEDSADTFAMALTEVRGGVPRTVEFKLDKTGKETVTKIGPTEVRTVLTFERGAMFEKAVLSTPDGEMVRKAKVTVSADRKTILKESVYAMPNGDERRDKILLEKQ
jgi:hypothetical protein